VLTFHAGGIITLRAWPPPCIDVVGHRCRAKDVPVHPCCSRRAVENWQAGLLGPCALRIGCSRGCRHGRGIARAAACRRGRQQLDMRCRYGCCGKQRIAAADVSGEDGPVAPPVSRIRTVAACHSKVVRRCRRERLGSEDPSVGGGRRLSCAWFKEGAYLSLPTPVEHDSSAGAMGSSPTNGRPTHGRVHPTSHGRKHEQAVFARWSVRNAGCPCGHASRCWRLPHRRCGCLSGFVQFTAASAIVRSGCPGRVRGHVSCGSVVQRRRSADWVRGPDPTSIYRVPSTFGLRFQSNDCRSSA